MPSPLKAFEGFAHLVHTAELLPLRQLPGEAHAVGQQEVVELRAALRVEAAVLLVFSEMGRTGEAGKLNFAATSFELRP